MPGKISRVINKLYLLRTYALKRHISDLLLARGQSNITLIMFCLTLMLDSKPLRSGGELEIIRGDQLVRILYF